MTKEGVMGKKKDGNSRSCTGITRRGFGVASGLWAAGGGGHPSAVVVKLFPDGSVNLNKGATGGGCCSQECGAS